MNQPQQVSLPAARRLALSVVIGQAAITGLAALVALAWSGSHAGWSALLGGGISTLASLAMYALAFRHPAGTDPRQIARGFYLGEATKVGVTILLLAWSLAWLRPAPLALLGSYIATLAAYWMALAGESVRGGKGSNG